MGGYPPTRGGVSADIVDSGVPRDPTNPQSSTHPFDIGIGCARASSEKGRGGGEHTCFEGRGHSVDTADNTRIPGQCGTRTFFVVVESLRGEERDVLMILNTIVMKWERGGEKRVCGGGGECSRVARLSRQTIDQASPQRQGRETW